MLKNKSKKHKHRWKHIKKTWYVICKCGTKAFIGLGSEGALNYVCHSHNQKECRMENAVHGENNPDMCWGCESLY
ncbi:MAG: hypothetical protein WDK96_02655 [Candidatus Paceibacterota bacterium]|jgi:hypothetical protein